MSVDPRVIFQVESVPEERYMEVPRAAKYLGVSNSRMQQLADKGYIPCKRRGRRRAFDKLDLDKYMESLEDWLDQKVS